MDNKDESIKKAEDLLKKTVNHSINSINDIMKSKTFICSMYFIKYIKDKDQKSYEKFIALFERMNYQEMLQVIANVKANLDAQEEQKKKLMVENYLNKLKETQKIKIRRKEMNRNE